MDQNFECPDEEKVKEAKKSTIREKRNREKEKLKKVKEKINNRGDDKKQQKTFLKILECASMKGASNWLTTLPLQEENRTLNKSEFRDALAIRYGWRPKNLPQKCSCGAENTIAHCLDCKLGGFVTMRHNQTRNTIARLLQKAGCKGVEIEQQLLPVEGELDGVKGVEKGDEARMDVTAFGLWGAWQRAFFDIRVFDPIAPSYAQKSINTLFQTHEKEKKRKYNKRILEIEKASFTPLVFTTTGGCGKECDLVIKKLATLISEKTKSPQSIIMNWIRTELGFTLLRSCIVCLRGWRRAKNTHLTEEIDFEISHAQTKTTHHA